MSPSALILAPFARGLGSGGSQRATALADQLERWSWTVEWEVVPDVPLRGVQRIRSAVLGASLAVTSHPVPSTAPPPPHDVVVAIHSYLGVPEARTRGQRMVVDFQDLQFDAVSDIAALSRGLRRLLWSQHARRAKRQDVAAARLADVVVAPTAREAAWIEQTSHRPALVLPNTLPHHEVEESRDIADRRSRTAPAPVVVYVGTLDYVANTRSLDRFLAQAWPAIRARSPRVQLAIAGRCGDADADRWRQAPATQVLGFVPDLTELLTTAAAAVLPIEMSAGSSLRVLKFGLAALPMVGTPQAFRGFDVEVHVVDSPEQWARAVAQILDDPAAAAEQAAANRATLDAAQGDPEPWEQLRRALQA